MPIDLSNKQSRWLIELENNGTTNRLTTWTADVTVGPDTYTSAPEMEVTLPPNTGSLEDRAAVVELLLWVGTLTWIGEAIAGNPIAPTHVTVIQQAVPPTDDPLVAGEVATVYTWVYRALLAKATKNPGGRSEVAKLTFVTEKGQMNVPLGLSGTRTCQWILFGRGCGLDPVTDDGTLTAIDGTDPKKVTITGFATPAAVPGATPGNTWHRGYIECDGIRIGIRDWDAATPGAFYLHRRAPAAWVGQTVTLVAGCDKTIGTCRGRYTNESKFAAAGYATPDHNTVLETGST